MQILFIISKRFKRVMKFSFFLMLVTMLHVTASVYSQTSTINVDKQNATIADIFNAIEQQTQYKIFYNNDQLNVVQPSDIKSGKMTVDEALTQVLRKSNCTYTIVDKMIVISPKTVQQGVRVTGKVSDSDGELLPGVNVIVRGSNTGTTTDINGEFSLTVPSDTSVLQFRFIGCRMQEVMVGKQRIIAVTMQEESTKLGEVVVVAFGTQKKESVVGSVTTVNVRDLKMPTSNLTTTLAGNMSGVIAYQRSGEPGQDNADFFVRGITTFGTNTNPLILIDGVELTSTDLAKLRPDDIESFSILKDATATALYGARGANGVVLVTTKQGQIGPPKVSLRVENSFSMPTQTVKVADPVTYMKLHNEAILTRDPLERILYSQEKVEMTEAGVYPVIFPTNDWKKLLFRDYTMNQRTNMSVSGGVGSGTSARYYISGSYNRDNGMMKVDKRQNFNNNIAINNYNLRTNVNVDLTKTTEIIMRLSANFEEYKGPIPGGTEVYNMMIHSNPVLFPAYYPYDEDHEYVEHILFGNYNNSKKNPYAEMIRGYKEQSRSQILAQVELKQELKFITEGLSARGMLNISRLSQFAVNRAFEPFYYQIGGAYNRQTGKYSLTQTKVGTEYLGYQETGREQNSTFYFEGQVNYSREFGKHGVSGLLVYQARQSLDALAGSLQLSLPSRGLGLSGRTTYSFDRRYFAEFNFGYNGTERFDKTHRFGFFPSAGAAWSISNERFWENIKPVVSNLKLRYSYGLIGNDQIGDKKDRFYYISEVNLDDGDRGMVFGMNYDERHPGVSVSRYANPQISWETAAKQNFALELGLWNKLSVIAEYYTEYRTNILMNRTYIPTTMGLSADVRANVGEASSRGVDISLEYQQNWTPDFWTSARANLTYAISKYRVFEEPEYLEPGLQHVGRSIRAQWGYIAERLFVDDEEALASPPQAVGSERYKGGDIKYVDINHDGKIDVNDRVTIGNPTMPELVYGFGFSTGYKGFDFSVFFQGATRHSFWIDVSKTAPFVGDAQILKAYSDSYWSEDTQDIYATWPRLSSYLHTNNSATSTWWMRDGTFLRLKQAELGYSLPSRLTERIRMSGLRFYLSGSNLLLFSRFKLWDVEMAGNGLGYPIQRVFNVGLNLSFN